MSSGQPQRLSTGGLIDRSAPLRFSFDGKAMTGFAGDTLASALLANGVRLVGRSFKYHRPRGIFTAGPEEPNALVELRSGARREPNTKATTSELFEGLEARSQNRWPSLSFDLMAVNSLFSPLLAAGFYYKTFKWPAAFWERVYEPLIRRAAGLGRASGLADPDAYEKAWAHCDVLIIGGGAAGLSAALAAGRAGARVILAEEDRLAGGRLLGESEIVDDLEGRDWAERATRELEALPNVRIMRRTSVFGVYDGEFGALERVSDHLPQTASSMVRQRLWRIVARASVLASGAIERPIAFGGNDRPGVMMASAVRTYVNRFAVVPGKSLALFTNNDDGWKTLETARKAGIEIAGIIDARPAVSDAQRKLAEALGVPMTHGVVRKVKGGASGIDHVELAGVDGTLQRLKADILAVSGGWNPSIGLTSHHGARPRFDEAISALVADRTPPGMHVAGSAAGAFSTEACLRSGHEAGVAAASACGHEQPAGAPARGSADTTSLTPLWHVEGAAKAFVDLQHDVTVGDIALARREGFEAVEHLKRYTTLGMATDQGKTSNVTGLAIMAQMTGRSIEKTGTTLYRPPHVPVAIGAFAGRSRGGDFRPVRLPPSHQWAREQGAVFVDVGQWKRAQWYPQKGERDWLESVDREVTTVRSGVGFCDVSTLGKIDVMGPDAGAFLDRVYINGFSGLTVGKARYGLMLREDGIVMDDGTTARLADDHYFMTTTTAKAGPVMQHLEFCRQVLWPELDVQLASCTDQWAQFSIAGPQSRELVSGMLAEGEDVSDAAFPFMAARHVRLAGGLQARLFRISFSGERAYEISLPARYGDAMARRLAAAGATPYGTEALGVMRIEKGHVAGPELNGNTTAGDLGMDRMMSRKKDFIGRVMAGREALVAPDRPVLVGLKPVDPSVRLRSGAHIFARGAAIGPQTDEGYVTSVCHSPTLGQWIGLGLVQHGRDRHGEVVRVHDPLRGGDCEVEICSPVFYDPEGSRQRG